MTLTMLKYAPLIKRSVHISQQNTTNVSPIQVQYFWVSFRDGKRNKFNFSGIVFFLVRRSPFICLFTDSPNY